MITQWLTNRMGILGIPSCLMGISQFVIEHVGDSTEKVGGYSQLVKRMNKIEAEQWY